MEDQRPISKFEEHRHTVYHELGRGGGGDREGVWRDRQVPDHEGP